MSIIKNLDKIQNLLSEKNLQKLEAHAHVFDQISNINFEVVGVVDNEISILVTQINTNPKYLTTQRELEKRAKSLFEFYFPDHVILVNSSLRRTTQTDFVNPDWIQKKLNSKGITLNKIVEETGIDMKRLNIWLSGAQSMSAPVKAMFWYI